MRRIGVEIDDELYARLDKVFPWGVRSAIIRHILEMIADETEKRGDVFLGALLSGHIKLAAPEIEAFNE